MSAPIQNQDQVALLFAANFQWQYVQFTNITQLSQYYFIKQVFTKLCPRIWMFTLLGSYYINYFLMQLEALCRYCVNIVEKCHHFTHVFMVTAYYFIPSFLYGMKTK